MEMNEFVTKEIERLTTEVGKVKEEFDTARAQAEAQYNQLVGYFQGKIEAHETQIREWTDRLEKEDVADPKEVVVDGKKS